MKREALELKRICGVVHVKARCYKCEGLCWTQWKNKTLLKHYICHTCDKPKLIGVGREDYTHGGYDG